MKKMKNKGLAAAILSMAFVQMTMNTMGVILPALKETFHRTDVSLLQSIMSLPNIFIVIMSFASAFLCRYFHKRQIIECGLMLVCLSGAVSIAFHESLLMLFAGSALLGTGIGLVLPLELALIAEKFEGHDRAVMMGLKSSAANLGSILMLFIGGIVASKCWYGMFYSYFIVIPAMILTLFYVPKEKTQREKNVQEKEKVPRKVWIYSALTLVFMSLYMAVPSNIGLLISEKSLGDSVMIGAITSLFQIGGMVSGFLFGRLDSKLEGMTIVLGYGLLAAGFVLLGIAAGYGLLLPGMFLTGASESLVMSQCIMQMNRGKVKSPGGTALIMSIALASGNLGAFFVPVYTNLAAVLMKTAGTAERFLFLARAAAVAAVVSAFLLYKESRFFVKRQDF